MRLRIHAPAKINLTLDVLGKRADGYHEIRSVVQAVSLCDVVEIRPASEISLTTLGRSVPREGNLALLAARRFRQTIQRPDGAHITLTKRVPISAGLGGGSSDAAAVLRLLECLWRPGMSTRALDGVAAGLGSDVPFFLIGPAAFVSGRGETVEPVPPLRDPIVLVMPPWDEPDKTARVYGNVAPPMYSAGELTGALAEALRRGRQVSHSYFGNGLQPAAQKLFPRLARLHQRLEELTSQPFTLSGAGPTLFHVASSMDEARRLARLVRGLVAEIRVVRPLRALTRIRLVELSSSEH